MTSPHEQSSASPVEQMLVDPSIQQGLANAFLELDTVYANYDSSHETPLTRLGSMMMTKSGLVLEASKKTPDDVYENKNDTPDDYLVFAFNLSEVLEPGFTPQPLPLTAKEDTQYRGSGTATKLIVGTSVYSVDQAAPERPIWLPEIITTPNLKDEAMRDAYFEAAGDDKEKSKQWREYAIKLASWQNLNAVNLHRFNNATYVITEFMGQAVEPLSEVRERMGIELPTAQTSEKPTLLNRSLGRLPFKKKL